MNIYYCRRGHRQRSEKTSVRGSCQRYSGQVCRQQLQHQGIFVPHNKHPAVTDKLIAGIKPSQCQSFRFTG